MKAAKEAATRGASASAPSPAPTARPHTTEAPALAGEAAAAPKRDRTLTDANATTAIHIPRADLALLRRVAVERANRDGGRPSVSDVIRELVERHRAELEAETGR
jgi:hypothetical protein